MSDDYMSRLDDMLGDKSMSRGTHNDISISKDVESQPSIHPLWKLIDTWGGTMYLKARQLTLWGVEP